MIINKISGEIVDTAVKIHKELGPGLFESVYEEIMFYELKNKGFKIDRQRAIPVYWENEKMDMGFRSDLIVDNKVLIEIKSIESVANVHLKQILTYLRLTDIKVGLLINFNEALVKDGITRVVNKL